MDRHKESRSHHESLRGMEKLAEKGGVDGLHHCDGCGLYLSHKQLQGHEFSRRHAKYVLLRVNGGKKCP